MQTLIINRSVKNNSEEAIINLLEGRVKNGERTFLNGLSQGAYGDGTVANSIGGLQLLVADSPTTGTVGGIDRSQFSFWQNITFSASTNGGAPTSAANIQDYMDQLYVQLVRGNDHPDLIVADNAMYRFYLSSLQAIQRLQGDTELANLGFETLKYLNADVVLDGGYQGQASDPLPFQTSGSANAIGGAPASHMYFLNTNFIHWRPYAGRNMVPLDPDRFSVNQDAMVRLIGWAGNASLSCAFLQGVIKT